ncbi:immunity 49 family protein [Streptomyces sp. BE133]|uniref:immunity 49 family protein n=1 Tax=Streptomyces sp. BE133 TaxID=3002523 RepID=UPI002E799501|nr:immunity 49 family protein [Streptomyces sp. BE133]MEE1811390.1 immunity 49 family protein [Streptomyces sp. BE133]
MVAIVSRHPFPTANAAAGLAVLQESAEGLVEGLETDSTDLGDALRLTLTLAKSHCLLDAEAALLPTWQAWVNAMQVSSAVFATANTTEGNVHCRIAEKDRTLRATGPQPYTHADAWLTAFYLSMVCREKDRLTALCQVPVSLLRESGARYDEFEYAWVETLQTYWLGGPDLGAKLVAAVDGTDPEVVTIGDPETVAKLIYPPIEMFHRLVRQDRAGFNRALTEALQWHKDYWSTEDNALQATGLVALAPLAIACLAYDAGFPVEVESEYLPIALLERSWAGEFPT